MTLFRVCLTILLTAALLLTGGGRHIARAADPPPLSDSDAAYARLGEGLAACAETIDLSPYRLTAAELGRIYTRLLQDSPELFHVAPRLSFTVRDGTDPDGTERWVGEVYPVYTMTGDGLTAARRFYRDRITAILAEMEEAFARRPPTEADIVLYLHDYLADRYAYDTREDVPEEARGADAYSLLRDGVGICQAYALAFMALARGAGLEADFVASAAMDHAWNHVRVDGVWYHVDVTRDDPIPAADGQEQVNHARLLRSDEGMAALGYHGFSCAAGHTCADRRFESGGEADLAEFSSPLIPTATGWLGETATGAPVAVTVPPSDGFSTGPQGDIDQDGALTPADLLTLYGVTYPESWREWVRAAVAVPPVP